MLIFEEGAPERAVYDVQIFPKARNGAYKPEGESLDYSDYCEAAGWKLVDGRGKFLIFKKMREDAVPIVTDEEKLENVRKSTRSTFWALLGMMLCATLYFLSFWDSLDTDILDNGELYLVLLWTILGLESAFDILVGNWRLHQIRKTYEQTGVLFYGRMNPNNPKLPAGNPTIILAFRFLLVALMIALTFRLEGVVVGIAVTVPVSIVFALYYAAFRSRPERSAANGLQIMIFLIIFLMPTAIITIMLPDEEGTPAVAGAEITSSYFGYMVGGAEKEDLTYDHYHLNEYVPDFIRERMWKCAQKQLGKVASHATAPERTGDAPNLAVSWNAKEAIEDEDGTLFLKYDQDILIIYSYSDKSTTSESKRTRFLEELELEA